MARRGVTLASKLVRSDVRAKWIENVRVIIWAVLLALVFRSCAFEPYRVPTGSMIPNILIGDYIFVSKFAYGYSRYSFPFSPGIVPAERIFADLPQRGDIIVFRLPTDTDQIYVKRLVGLPGDQVQVRGGTLYVNGTVVERTLTEPYSIPFGRDRLDVPQYVEHLPHGQSDASSNDSGNHSGNDSGNRSGGQAVYRVIEQSGSGGFADNTEVYIVPDGYFFAMGDNRDASQDSRFQREVGFIPYENLIGKAVMILISIDNEGWGLRWGRTFFTPD